MSQEPKLIESVPLREAWRDWVSDPPTIGRASIEIQIGGHRQIEAVDGFIRFFASMGCLPDAWWRPTGIYREEYYSVTGQWI